MIIDGTDIRTLGMFILRGGSNDFLSFPERREPDTNDWAEYDGLEVDFEDLSYNPKKISVQLYISAPDTTTFNQRLNAFQTLNNQQGYRQVFVKEFNRTFLLRYLGCADYKHKGGLATSGKKSGRLTVEYMMDNPLQLFSTQEAPVGNKTTHVKLGELDLGQYGIIVKEIYSTALNPGMRKPVLERSIKNISGISADVSFVPKKQALQTTIDCVMIADTLQDFYTNYNALFGLLNMPVPIALSTHSANYQCYYKSMSGFTKETAFSRKVRVSFQLNLQTI
ncbi:MAG TPA: hypothetical protein GXZ87_07685 [Bacteroidales bacterium]|nr:hypothetical protein [Bacteroidales bacterium]